MTIAEDHLYNLLPAVYRERDAANGNVLRQYLRVLTDELAVVAEGLEQLYDDLFVETAAPWVLPYLAELVGLKGVASGEGGGLAPRAEVANTIAYRRRKGTAAVLEQLARDTTGWPARAVEFFELLATCQHMNHVRPGNRATVSVRSANRLEFVNTPFERGIGGDPDLVHLAEMRRIPRRRGRYNIPNVGLFLWRQRAYPLTRVPILPVAAGDQHRFLLDPMGAPVTLFSPPVSEAEITHLAEPINVPMPISRRMAAASLASYYGPDLSFAIDGVAIDAIDICDLRDDPATPGTWAHTPAASGRVLVDPVLGRVVFGDAQNGTPRAMYHHGFCADVGGGEYNRVQTFATTDGPRITVAADGSAMETTIAGAVATLAAGGGTIEVHDNARYDETFALTADAAVELRAADGRRPVLVLGGDLAITLSNEAEVAINGLVIAGAPLRVAGAGRLVLRHCTLVPGLSLDANGAPVQPGAASVFIETGATVFAAERCITGGIRSHVDAELRFTDCIIDAGERGVAFASDPDGSGPGGTVTFDECTVFGRVHARVLERLSNSVVLAVVPPGEEGAWPGPFLVDRRQEGCARFSYLPAGSRTPRRYRCVPVQDADAAALRPVFVSSRYGHAGYGELDRRTPDAVWRGAEDESEMGAFHHLHQAHREAYLEARLQEYLRFGLEAGLFFAS